MVPSKDPYREKELSTSPLGPMEPEVIKEELFAKPKLISKLIPKPKTLARDIEKILLVLGFGMFFFMLIQIWAMWATVTR